MHCISTDYAFHQKYLSNLTCVKWHPIMIRLATYAKQMGSLFKLDNPDINKNWTEKRQNVNQI